MYYKLGVEPNSKKWEEYENSLSLLWIDYAYPDPTCTASTRYPFINFEVEIPIPIDEDMQDFLKCNEYFMERLKEC